jgi:hypothetical protein
MIPFANLDEYLPFDDLLKILVVCVSVAVIAPSAAALVITGFETQATARQAGGSRLAGDLRIGLGVAVMVAMIAVGLYALVNQ